MGRQHRIAAKSATKKFHPASGSSKTAAWAIVVISWDNGISLFSLAVFSLAGLPIIGLGGSCFRSGFRSCGPLGGDRFDSGWFACRFGLRSDPQIAPSHVSREARLRPEASGCDDARAGAPRVSRSCSCDTEWTGSKSSRVPVFSRGWDQTAARAMSADGRLQRQHCSTRKAWRRRVDA